MATDQKVAGSIPAADASTSGSGVIWQPRQTKDLVDRKVRGGSIPLSRTSLGEVSELVERPASKSGDESQCGFESHPPHQRQVSKWSTEVRCKRTALRASKVRILPCRPRVSGPLWRLFSRPGQTAWSWVQLPEGPILGNSSIGRALASDARS